MVNGRGALLSTAYCLLPTSFRHPDVRGDAGHGGADIVVLDGRGGVGVEDGAARALRRRDAELLRRAEEVVGERGGDGEERARVEVGELRLVRGVLDLARAARRDVAVEEE